jgi:hypothetical protein
VFELLKIIVDLFALKDASDKGMLSWKVVLFGFGFAIFLFATGVPAASYYQNHPEAKNIFFAVIAMDALAFLLFMIFGIRWYRRGLARYRASQAAKDEISAS